MSQQIKTLPLPPFDKTYRVVQWATGKVGSRSLQAVIRHPKMELAGLYVHSEAKEGKDAGDLCGLDPVGVAATRNIDDIIALKPDCVLYMQEGTNFDDLCRLLESGINIVTTRGDFHFPPMMDPHSRRRTEEACAKGGTAIHGTGSSPGFITEAMPLVLTSIARRLDCLTIDEYADITNSCSDEMMFGFMGYGQPNDGNVNQIMLDYSVHGFGQSLAVVADALGLPIDSVEGSGETAATRSGVTTPSGGVIEKGTVGALRLTVAGMKGGEALLRFRANWYCSLDVEADWNLRDSGWRVQVDGDTPMDIHIQFPRTSEPYQVQMAGLTAHRAVNAVPYVCAAQPGIHTTADLPQIIARLG